MHVSTGGKAGGEFSKSDRFTWPHFGRLKIQTYPGFRGQKQRVQILWHRNSVKSKHKHRELGMFGDCPS